MPQTIPSLGLGTFGRNGKEGLSAIATAIEIGYRHLDTAQMYGNEDVVGDAVRLSGVPRRDFFVTTKVDRHSLAEAEFLPSVEISLQKLGMDWVDLLLIHWPPQSGEPPLERYMEHLAEAKARGLARMIGVSNFPIALLERCRQVLGDGALATNQVELHPFLQAPKLRDYARTHGLRLTAYRPIAKSLVMENSILRAIGEAHGADPATISLAFLIAEGHIVIPASSREENLRSNWRASRLTLTEGEKARIRLLDRGTRSINPAHAPEWDD